MDEVMTAIKKLTMGNENTMLAHVQLHNLSQDQKRQYAALVLTYEVSL